MMFNFLVILALSCLTFSLEGADMSESDLMTLVQKIDMLD